MGIEDDDEKHQAKLTALKEKVKLINKKDEENRLELIRTIRSNQIKRQAEASALWESRRALQAERFKNLEQPKTSFSQKISTMYTNAKSAVKQMSVGKSENAVERRNTSNSYSDVNGMRGMNPVAAQHLMMTNTRLGGGSKSKEILGKIRRVYKVAGSRKEHIKYKGNLIPVADYKKLMK
jgi:hypothetical protein